MMLRFLNPIRYAGLAILLATNTCPAAGARPNVVVFLADDQEHYFIELTHNRDGRDYELGDQFGHLAFTVDDLESVVARVEEQSWWYRRSKPGNASKYIFVKDPNGYDIEILQAR